MKEAVKKLNSIDSCSITVTGMDCPDCAARIERAVKRIPGVAEANVAFPLGKLSIDYDSTQTGVQQVVKKVKSLGYDANEDPVAGDKSSDRTTTICINGMDCADCAARLEKSIVKISGVGRAQVNFGASKMTVVHQGSITEILDAIKKMGYSGKVDQGVRQKPVSFWKTNQYAIPTVISFVMLVLGVLSERMETLYAVADAFFLIGIILGGFLPAKNGVSVLISTLQPDMNVLMTIAVAGAAAIGQYEEAATVVFLFSLGNVLQGYTLDRTRNSIRDLMELAPNQALVSRNGVEVNLPVEEIETEEVIIVRPGERIPMDGKVLKGFSSVNQAPITGESLPVDKNIGDEVYAGAINGRGSLEIAVTRLAKDNTISRIISMVEEAQGQRAPSQQLIDRFAKYYTPLVITGAAMVASVPPLVFGQPFEKWFYEAMAMMLVACPCALVISTPVSIVSAIGSAARRGVLIKGGAHLEEAGALSAVAFDKTGTLTAGKPQVTDIVNANGYSDQEIIAAAAAIESRSAHPVGEAITKYAKEKGIIVLQVSNFEEVFGKGAKGDVEGKEYQIGNSEFLTEKGFSLDAVVDAAAEFQDKGKTTIFLASTEKIMGVIAVADVLRDNAVKAVEGLKKAGVRKVIMLTGDNPRTALVIARKAGIDEYRAGLLPEGKVSAMKDLMARHGKVAMVGDGVNDAPAMAASTIGIAMGAAGADAALETADIALMADDLTKLSSVVQLGRRTLRIIKQNIAFALIVKGLILLLVVPGWLTLWLAVAGDMGSSLLVTLNGMRLLKIGHNQS